MVRDAAPALFTIPEPVIDPCRPAVPSAVGTFSLPEVDLDTRYTIGRRHVREPALWLAEHTNPLAVDIETGGLGRAAMLVKSVTVASPTHAVVLDPRDPYQADVIRQALTLARSLVFHNSPYDVPILVRTELMRLVDIAKVWDSLIYCRLAEPDERTRKSLSAAASRYLGTSAEDLLSRAFKALGLSKTNGFKFFDLNRPVYVHGAALDGIITARLLPLARRAAYARLTSGHPFVKWGVTGANAAELVDREQVVNRLFLRRTARGLRVDLDRLDAYADTVREQQHQDQAVLTQHGIAAGNGNSLTGWLDERGLLPAGYPRTPKTNMPSSTADHLKLITHPVALAFSRLKESVKVEKDYLAKVVDLADNDRVHPSVSILGATTGRAAMSGPPLHQFPGEARGIILADEGDRITSIDWSAVEPVIAANIARDVEALRGYDERGEKFYDQIVATAGISYKAAKIVLLAQLYGQGLALLAANLTTATGHLHTIEDAKALKIALFKTMPRVQRMIYRIKDVGEAHQLIFTLSGRILPVPMGKAPPSFGDRAGEWMVQSHKSVNYLIQGSAYDLLAETLIAVDTAGLGDALYLAMHDELVVSTEAADDIRRIMEIPPERLCRMAGRTPVLRTDRADLGERWAAA